MTRKFGASLLFSLLMMLGSAGICLSGDEPTPAETPDDPSELGADTGMEMINSFRGGWLGVSLADVTSDKMKDLKLSGEYGAIVEDVVTSSPAANAGFKKGDVIVEFSGQRVLSAAQLRRMIRETPAGRTVNLKVIREGRTQTLNAKLQSRKESFHIQVPEIQIPPIEWGNVFGPAKPALGISGDELTTQLAEFFGVKQGKGVLVREVLVGSAAEKAGLKAGDVIVAVDGKSVTTIANLRQYVSLGAAEESHKVSLTIVRNHHEQTIPVEIKQADQGVNRKAVERLKIDLRKLQELNTLHMAEARNALQTAQAEWNNDRRRMVEDILRETKDQQRVMEETRKALRNLRVLQENSL